MDIARSRSPLVLLAIVVALVLVVGAAGWALFSLKGTPLGGGAIPGTLIMEVPGTWTAPSGETVEGLISYTPSTGDISYPLSPDDPLLGLMVPDSISPDGGKFAALLPPNAELDFGGALVVISFALRQPVLPIEPSTDALGISDFVWGPEGAKFAYSALIGVARPELRVAPRFDDQPDYGIDRPLAFSPDGTMLLVREELTLAIIDLSNGFRTPITGISDFASSPIESFAVSPDGTYLATHDFNGVRAYTLDWAGAEILPIGFVEKAASPIFNDVGQLLVRMSDASGRAYQPGNRLALIGTLELPEGAELIRWIVE